MYTLLSGGDSFALYSVLPGTNVFGRRLCLEPVNMLGLGSPPDIARRPLGPTGLFTRFLFGVWFLC